jgi:hypothetical protein
MLRRLARERLTTSETPTGIGQRKSETTLFRSTLAFSWFQSAFILQTFTQAEYSNRATASCDRHGWSMEKRAMLNKKSTSPAALAKLWRVAGQFYLSDRRNENEYRN